jgi:polyisoprenoid-binding protein YceI
MYKYKILALVLALLIPTLAIAHNHGSAYTIDPNASSIRWEGKKVAYAHWGTIKFQSGSLDLMDGKLHGGNFDVNMNSMVNDDVEDPGKNAQLVGHLKSDDFFSVDSHPTSSFKITRLLPNAFAKAGEANYTVSGDLTIKGKTHPISFPAIINVQGDKLTANATFKFDRSKYDVRFASGNFFENLGDNLIMDEIEMEIKIVANKK